jgi:hypothetical protein
VLPDSVPLVDTEAGKIPMAVEGRTELLNTGGPPVRSPCGWVQSDMLCRGGVGMFRCCVERLRCALKEIYNPAKSQLSVTDT